MSLCGTFRHDPAAGKCTVTATCPVTLTHFRMTRRRGPVPAVLVARSGGEVEACAVPRGPLAERIWNDLLMLNARNGCWHMN
jgi:hypothetical protein